MRSPRKPMLDEQMSPDEMDEELPEGTDAMMDDPDLSGDYPGDYPGEDQQPMLGDSLLGGVDRGSLDSAAGSESDEDLPQADSILNPKDPVLLMQLQKLLQTRAMARNSQAEKVFEKNINENITRNTSDDESAY